MNKDYGKEIAGKIFDVQDYDKKDETSAGLAMTHEQATDDYTEGTIDGKMENVAGEDINLQDQRKKNK
ncbi:MAG TPA: YozQ family protein [Bacillus sp. (in: firmicutes)]|uniref:YozQ family protein n=1 Tax=Bacillus litorisediminis TaxID=2922713 RepID=UPI001FAD859F|nr:YozQ family protein [Bacillus litorisediminis]HWO75677.1 YozQ family protein [Bacillus sp. (in: firmicutes)]